MTELPTTYDFDNFLRHGIAEVSQAGRSIVVRTPVEQWAYAVSFPRVEVSAPGSALIIRFLVRVSQGAVGIGCLDETGESFLDEVSVGPTDASTVAEIVIVDAAAAGELVIRNMSNQGSSEVQIDEVTWSVVEATDQVREPPLSEPHPMNGWSRYYGEDGETVLERIRARQFAALQEAHAMTWADGLQLIVKPGEQLSRALYISGTYEPNTLTILRRLTPPDGVFVDVGANVGVVSVVAAAWVGTGGRVFAFEPSGREFDRLVENVRLNRLDQVTPVRAAVMDRHGAVDLRVAADGFAGLNTLAASFPYSGVEADRVERVPAIMLDDYFAHPAISRVDVIKIDVEGAEGAVLAGSSRVLQEYRPAIVAEVFSRSLHGSGWDRARVGALLDDAIYDLFAIDDDTARLTRLASLETVDEQNIVALPREQVGSVLARLQDGTPPVGR